MALFGVHNGGVSPNGADASAAMAAAGFHGSFPANTTGAATVMGDYSNATEIDSSSGMLKLVLEVNFNS